MSGFVTIKNTKSKLLIGEVADDEVKIKRHSFAISTYHIIVHCMMLMSVIGLFVYVVYHEMSKPPELWQRAILGNRSTAHFETMEECKSEIARKVGDRPVRISNDLSWHFSGDVVNSHRRFSCDLHQTLNGGEIVVGSYWS